MCFFALGNSDFKLKISEPDTSVALKKKINATLVSVSEILSLKSLLQSAKKHIYICMLSYFNKLLMYMASKALIY